MARVNELTNYPSTFKGTYWSNRIYEMCDAEIIQNRNEFVEKFNIKKHCLKYPNILKLYCNITIGKGYEKVLRLKNFIQIPGTPDKFVIDKTKIESMKYGRENSCYQDHLEVYKTNDDKYIIISSPYKQFDENDMLYLERCGWKQLYKLYDSNASTIYKVLDKNELSTSNINNIILRLNNIN